MTDSNDFAIKIARKAMPELIQLRIAPTPENYALWYLYITGREKALTERIEQMKAASEEFDETAVQALKDNYLSPYTLQHEMQRHTFSVQSLMSDLLEMISSVTGETTAYNKNLGGYVDKLSGKYTEAGVENMVKELLEKTIQIRENGSDLTGKLADSKREVEELRENLVRITEEANRDALTGLANRKAFDTHAQHLHDVAMAGDGEFSLLLLDIDHFKVFNDKYGHQVGDEVLKIVAREMMNAVKGRDVVARYGGEEFAVLLPSTGLGGALIVAENLRKNIAGHTLSRKDTKESYGTITVSIGAAQFHAPKDTVEALVRRADEALYRSKKGGRNRVTQETYLFDKAANKG